MDDDGTDYMLSLACIDGEHSITLLKSSKERGGGYVTQGQPFYTDDLTEFFGVLTDAYDGELSIFLNHYEIDLDDGVDNDNEPMIKLVHDEDNTSQ
jgi:hypothetical protein